MLCPWPGGCCTHHCSLGHAPQGPCPTPHVVTFRAPLRTPVPGSVQLVLIPWSPRRARGNTRCASTAPTGSLVPAGTTEWSSGALWWPSWYMTDMPFLSHQAPPSQPLQVVGSMGHWWAVWAWLRGPPGASASLALVRLKHSFLQLETQFQARAQPLRDTQLSHLD